jgi:hypothetical protein
MMRHYSFVLLVLAGCSAKPPAGPQLVNGFNPPPVAAGYTRYVLPAVPQVQAGTDIIVCQWLAPPADTDIDIIDVTGQQTRGGHHVVLYATMDAEDVGTTRPCVEKDTTKLRFLGAVGGEGSANVKLPPGFVFRLSKGQALMANVHYLNASPTALDGQAVMDVRYSPVSAASKVAGMFVVNEASFTVPVSKPYTVDGYCASPRDISLVMFTDHMHEHGTAIFNETIRADGTRQMLASDPTWARDQIFNPLWTRWDPATPMVIKAGDQLHVHCEWQGSDKLLGFPDEMCIGLGFYIESGDSVTCAAKPNN